MPKKAEKKCYFWKGKHVTEKVYNLRLRQANAGKNLRKIYGCAKSSNQSNLKDKKEPNSSSGKVDGRRIVHIKMLGQQLICKKCNQTLSLLNTVDEVRFGLASIFVVKCESCQSTTRVATDKSHKVIKYRQGKKTIHYDVNSAVVLGSINAGQGCTDVNKVLAAIEVPPYHLNTFKVHEIEVGVAAEKLARDSCIQATLLERELTIKHVKELQKLLPDHLKNNFIFLTVNNIDHDNVTELPPDALVRIAAAFDMGWPTRGTGRQYDSLSGAASYIGFFSKKVLAYTSKNRKCRKCDLSHDPKDHDCRRNFAGSAKAMEPDAAAELANDNEIFKQCNVQIGIMIADNDSSHIAAVRAGCDHEVIKHSDKNHTSKGVINELYKINKEHIELNATSIKYLTRCFNYCVAQNVGNPEGMASAIKNITNHAFNNHSNCSSWCGSIKNPESYKHSVIGEGFKDQKLFDALKCLFAGRLRLGYRAMPTKS